MEQKTIKELRALTGLTQSEFGKRLGGIPLRTIQNWESGDRTPPAWTLELIAYRVEHDEAMRVDEQERQYHLNHIKKMMEWSAEMKKELAEKRKNKQ